jgi:transposase-like protein
MDKESLELLLDQGLSVERIAKRFGKDPSTVSYWMKKHGLVSPYREKHAAKGGIAEARLVELIESGASVATIAETLRISSSTVRHWLNKYGLETRVVSERRAIKAARSGGLVTIKRECRHHGVVDFWLEGRGFYRCTICRQEAVARRRRKVKQILVNEAGGRCALCGYDQCIAALHFHHLDPGEKSFTLSSTGVTRSLEKARHEASKCVLLCSNCHAEVEAGVRPLTAFDSGVDQSH